MPEVEFDDNYAHKHGYSKDDIIEALSDENGFWSTDKYKKRLWIGKTLSGNPVEIKYRELSDARILVYHCMNWQLGK